jgi:hypothetical protein
MIILRDKTYSGYIPILGTSYSSAQVGKAIDNGIDVGLDGVEHVVNLAGDTPVVGEMSSKIRNRVLSFTRPIKKLRRLRNKEKRYL